MLVQGSVYPPKIQIINYQRGNAIVKLRRNIKEKEIKNEDGSTDTLYEYEETEIIIGNRGNIEEYIEKNFDALFEMGLKQAKEVELSIDDRVQNLEKASGVGRGGQRGIADRIDSLEDRITSLEEKIE